MRPLTSNISINNCEPPTSYKPPAPRQQPQLCQLSFFQRTATMMTSPTTTRSSKAYSSLARQESNHRHSLTDTLIQQTKNNSNSSKNNDKSSTIKNDKQSETLRYQSIVENICHVDHRLPAKRNFLMKAIHHAYDQRQHIASTTTRAAVIGTNLATIDRKLASKIRSVLNESDSPMTKGDRKFLQKIYKDMTYAAPVPPYKIILKLNPKAIEYENVVQKLWWKKQIDTHGQVSYDFGAFDSKMINLIQSAYHLRKEALKNCNDPYSRAHIEKFDNKLRTYLKIVEINNRQNERLEMEHGLISKDDWFHGNYRAVYRFEALTLKEAKTLEHLHRALNLRMPSKIDKKQRNDFLGTPDAIDDTTSSISQDSDSDTDSDLLTQHPD